MTHCPHCGLTTATPHERKDCVIYCRPRIRMLENEVVRLTKRHWEHISVIRKLRMENRLMREQKKRAERALRSAVRTIGMAELEMSA